MEILESPTPAKAGKEVKLATELKEWHKPISALFCPFCAWPGMFQRVGVGQTWVQSWIFTHKGEPKLPE